MKKRKLVITLSLCMFTALALVLLTGKNGGLAEAILLYIGQKGYIATAHGENYPAPVDAVDNEKKLTELIEALPLAASINPTDEAAAKEIFEQIVQIDTFGKDSGLALTEEQKNRVDGVIGAFAPVQEQGKTLEITAKGGILRTGSYVLGNHVALTGSNLIIPENAQVTIDLNGYTLTGTGSGSVITIQRKATLYLKDSSFYPNFRSGTITGGNGTPMEHTQIAAAGGTCAVGGGVFVVGTLEMEGGTIADCTANSGGGVYVAGGTFRMGGGKIDNCTATGIMSVYGGGVQLSKDGAFLMEGGTISNCSVLRDEGIEADSFGGGGVSAYSGTFIMKGGIISGCTSDLHGGGVYVSDQEAVVELIDGTIEDCTAKINGGGVYLLNNNAIEMTGATIKNCRAKGGGAVCVQGAKGSLNLKGGNLTGLFSKTDLNPSHNAEKGGGVYVMAGTLNMTGGTIAGSSAVYGGGIYVGQKGSITITGGEVRECIATENGGGVYNNGSQSTLSGGKIYGCEARGNGGGAYVLTGIFELSGSATIENCLAYGSRLYLDKASEATSWDGGGGIYTLQEATLNISGGKIVDCNADTAYGGGVFNYGTFSFSGGEISGCTALGGGGILLAGNSSFTMSAGVIQNCRATIYNGGGINFNNGTMAIEGNPIIVENAKGANGNLIANNVYLPEGRLIGFSSSLSDGASIGIVTEGTFVQNASIPITTAKSKGIRYDEIVAYFIADMDDAIVEADNKGKYIKLSPVTEPPQ